VRATGAFKEREVMGIEIDVVEVGHQDAIHADRLLRLHHANQPLADFDRLQMTVGCAREGSLHQAFDEALKTSDQIHPPL
jgi:hypothetical protein